MTSPVSKYGAAISAKRIISTALIAKLEAITQLLPVNSDRKLARSTSLNPVVPTTACTPCIASHGNVTRAEAAVVKSTTTSHPAWASARSARAVVTPWHGSPAALRPTAATRSSSGSRATAAHTVRPMRPPAPTTPTLVCDIRVTVAASNASARGADRDHDRFGGEHAVDRSSRRSMVDRSPAGDLLVDRPNRASGDQLRTVAGQPRGRGFQAELERAGEVTDGHIQLVVGDAVGDEPVELAPHQVDHFTAVVRLGACVHLEGTAVGICRDTRVDRVGEAAAFADLLEQAARQTSSEDVVDDVQRLTIVVA